MKSRRLSSVLGLSISERRISAVWLRLSGSRPALRASLDAPLMTDVLKDDPELVGREIRQLLDAAEIGERRVAVVAPLSWSLFARTHAPELSPADLESYLGVEAERAFPFPPEELVRSVSFGNPTGEGRLAAIAAVPRKNLVRLESALGYARLQPISISFGISDLAVLDAPDSEPWACLLAGTDGLDLLVQSGGGILALRSLSSGDESEREADAPDPGALARELRITLGHLPEGVAERLRALHVYGSRTRVQALLPELSPLLGRLGLSPVPELPAARWKVAEEDRLSTLDPAALAAAARCLLSKPTDLQFLEPRKSRLRRAAGRITSRSALLYGGLAACAVLALAGAFLYQYWRMSRMEAQWSAIEASVLQLSALHEEERAQSPWFDDSVPSLLILRELTRTFPERGDVWLKTLEIRGLSEVRCTGSARSTRDWLQMREELGKLAGVEDLNVSRVQGDAPLQFTFQFRWNGEVSDGV